MADQSDYLKTVRDTLLAEREKLGLSTPAAQIGTRGSSGAIDSGMSSALEQLVLLAQLHAGRNEDDITRGYSDGTISLVRQYMADRGVDTNTIDKFTGSIQALDTPSQGQTKSTFDQQYQAGAADLTMLKIENATLLAGTQHGPNVAAARPLSTLFTEARDDRQPVVSGQPREEVAQTKVPAVPMRSYQTTYSYDKIQDLKDQPNRSIEQEAVLAAWDQRWKAYSDEKGFTQVDQRYTEATNAWTNRYTAQNEMYTQIGTMKSANERLLESLQDQPLQLKIDGQTIVTTWNKIYDDVGYIEWNDDDRETKLRKAGLQALEALKASSGYNDNAKKISELTTKAGMHVVNSEREYMDSMSARHSAFKDIRNDQVSITVQVPDLEAMPQDQRLNAVNNFLAMNAGGR